MNLLLAHPDRKKEVGTKTKHRNMPIIRNLSKEIPRYSYHLSVTFIRVITIFKSAQIPYIVEVGNTELNVIFDYIYNKNHLVSRKNLENVDGLCD